MILRFARFFLFVEILKVVCMSFIKALFHRTRTTA